MFFKSSISNKNYYNLFLMRWKYHYWFGSQVNAVMPRKQVNTLGKDSQYQVGTVFKRHISQWMDAANSNTRIWEYSINTDCLFHYIPIRTTFLDVRHAFRQRRKRPLFRPINCIPYILVEKYDPERKGGLGGGRGQHTILFYHHLLSPIFVDGDYPELRSNGFFMS